MSEEQSGSSTESDLVLETIQCGVCGMEIRDTEQGRREMEIHEAECDGLDDPHDRFEVGDRVEYSDFGRERLDRPERRGEIVGFGSERYNNEHCVRVRWDGRKTPERYAHRFIKHVEGEDKDDFEGSA